MLLTKIEEKLLIAAFKAENKALKAENVELKSIVKSLEIANDEASRVLSKLLDENLLFNCGGTA